MLLPAASRPPRPAPGYAPKSRYASSPAACSADPRKRRLSRRGTRAPRAENLHEQPFRDRRQQHERPLRTESPVGSEHLRVGIKVREIPEGLHEQDQARAGERRECYRKAPGRPPPTKKPRHSFEPGVSVYGLAVTYFRVRNAHYHRRKPVSRFCSGWEGVGPGCCGRQIEEE